MPCQVQHVTICMMSHCSASPRPLPPPPTLPGTEAKTELVSSSSSFRPCCWCQPSRLASNHVLRPSFVLSCPSDREPYCCPAAALAQLLMASQIVHRLMICTPPSPSPSVLEFYNQCAVKMLLHPSHVLVPSLESFSQAQQTLSFTV